MSILLINENCILPQIQIFYFRILLFKFARSQMRRNSHVWFCSRDVIQKEPSTITPKEPDSVNNIEEE